MDIKNTNNRKENPKYVSSSLPISYCFDKYDSLADHEIPFHWHDEFEFLLVLQGEIDCKIVHKNGTTLNKKIEKGSGMFFNSKSLHSMRASLPHSESKTLSFAKDFFGSLPSAVMKKNARIPLSQLPVPGIFLTPSSGPGQKILNKLAHLYKIDPQMPNYELYCVENICYILRHLLMIISHKNYSNEPKPEIKEIRLWTMISFIHENFSQPISTADISLSANISKSECFRCFNAIINQTPIEYLNNYRLAKAASSLIETNKTILTIAYECGFQNASYFGSMFKSKFQLTPGEYRKKFETSRLYLDCLHTPHPKD